MLLAGKVAIIFGGSGAIGGAVAHAMAREGALSAPLPLTYSMNRRRSGASRSWPSSLTASTWW